MDSSVPFQCINYTNINHTKQPDDRSKLCIRSFHCLVPTSLAASLCTVTCPQILYRAGRACCDLVMLPLRPHLRLSWHLLCPATLSAPWNVPNQDKETLTNWKALGNRGISKTSFVFLLCLVESLSRKCESSVVLWKSKSAKMTAVFFVSRKSDRALAPFFTRQFHQLLFRVKIKKA